MTELMWPNVRNAVFSLLQGCPGIPCADRRDMTGGRGAGLGSCGKESQAGYRIHLSVGQDTQTSGDMETGEIETLTWSS